MGDAIAACDIRGGAPGVFGAEVLKGENIVENIDGLFLSGGSAFGLASSAGMMDFLSQKGKGFTFGGSGNGTSDVKPVPIIAGAILFDLNHPKGKDWGEKTPYYDLARKACQNASTGDFALGNHGAGLGAVAGNIKGGLGSASAISEDGFEIGALVAVNPFASVIRPNSQRLWAADFELDGEMGAIAQSPAKPISKDLFADSKLDPKMGQNTTIAICATNAKITAGEAKRLAIMAQDGIARAVRPAHSLFDGDSLFVIATAQKEIDADSRLLTLTHIGGLMADCLTRAIGRGVFEAQSRNGIISYRENFGL